jgi:hypothetical protein
MRVQEISTFFNEKKKSFIIVIDKYIIKSTVFVLKRFVLTYNKASLTTTKTHAHYRAATRSYAPVRASTRQCAHPRASARIPQSSPLKRLC